MIDLEFPVGVRSGYTSDNEAGALITLPEGWVFSEATEHVPPTVDGLSFPGQTRLVRLAFKKESK